MGWFSSIFRPVKKIVNKVLDIVTDVVKVVGKIIEKAVEIIIETVEVILEKIIGPILEWFFGLFGFKDETIIEVQVTTAPFYGKDAELLPEIKKQIYIAATEDLDYSNQIKVAILDNYVTKTIKFFNYAELGQGRSVTSGTIGDGYVYGVPELRKSFTEDKTTELAAVLTGFHTGATSVTLIESQFGNLGAQSGNPYRYWAWWRMESDYASWNQGTLSWVESNYNNTCYLPTNFEVSTYWEGLVSAQPYYEATVEALGDLLAPAWEASSPDYTNASVSSFTWPYLSDNDQAEITIAYDNLGVPTSTTIVVNRQICSDSSPAATDIICGYTPNDAYYCTGTSTQSVTWTYSDTVTDNYGGYEIKFTGSAGNRSIYIPAIPYGIYYVGYYTVVGGTDAGKTYIWVYDESLGTYPTLDQDTSAVVTSGWDFYPFAILRKNSTYIDTNKSTQEYLTTKRLLNYIDVPVDDVLDGIRNNSNDGQLTDVYLNYAANLYSTVEEVDRYLFIFFGAVGQYANVTKAQYDAAIANSSVTTAPSNQIGFAEQNVNLGLQFNYIEVEDITGVIGPVGTTTKTINHSTTTLKGFNTNTVVLLSQYEPAKYARLTVKGLALVHFVTTSIGVIKAKAIPVTNPTDNSEAGLRAKANFSFPISKTIIRYTGSVTDQEQVLYKSLSFIAYSEQITYLRWYETEDFLNFIGVVITIAGIYFGFGDLSQFANLTVKQIVQKIIITIAIQVAVNYAVSKIDNPYIKALVRIAGSYATSYVWSGSTKFDLMDPIQALKAVDAVGGEYLTYETAKTYEQIQIETANWTQTRKEYEDELKRAQELLEYSTEVSDLLTLTKATYILNDETPTEYFDRVLQKNPGVTTLDAIRTFYDQMLDLPSLDPRFATNDVVTPPDGTVSS